MEITWELVRDLAPDLRGRRLAAPNVTYAGDAIALAMPPGEPKMLKYGPAAPLPPQEGWLSQELWHLEFLYPEQMRGPYQAHALIWTDERCTEVPLSDVEAAFPQAQLLAEGSPLLVSSRRRDEDNARLYSPDGRLQRTFAVGDAVEYVSVGEGDSIWIAYFDEGVFGDDEMSHSGLARFDREGRKEWGYNETRGDAPAIDDCYALNVGPDGAWACSYSEFELVHVRGNELRSWKQPVKGARALAVRGDRVLFFRSYDKPAGGWVGRLAEDTVEDLHEVTMGLPDGRELSALEHDTPPRRPYTVVGRGSSLHAFVEDRWYRLDLGEI